MRLWLKFERADAVAYISHLDAHRAYYRMFRRAGLQIKMSQGFNPHPILSLAAPLPLGFRSHADYVDVTLAEEMPASEVAERLSRVTGGEHLRFKDLAVITFKVPALAALIEWARYEIELSVSPESMARACAEFAGKSEVKFIKESKRGSRELDAKLLTREFHCADKTIRTVLALGQSAVFRPEELLKILEAGSADGYSAELITRQELYIERDCLLTPLEWVTMESERSG